MLSRIPLLLVTAFLSTSAIAHTDNYQDFYRTSGCRLMLCLQNPNGPMSVRECQQDVQAFYTELALAYYGHNVSIPICSPSMTNGSFFTIGRVQRFAKVMKGDGRYVYEWVSTGKLSVSTYINNQPWRQWAFSGVKEKITSVGLLTDLSEQSGQFMRVVPFTAQGMPDGGPYASALPKGTSLTQLVTNNTLLSRYTQSAKSSRFQNSNSNEYVRAWMKSTGYKFR